MFQSKRKMIWATIRQVLLDEMIFYKIIDLQLDQRKKAYELWVALNLMLMTMI
jgi:hypothetical protein